MKKFILLLLLTFTLQADTYTNSRFGFSIEYPAEIFINKTYPENGDGVWLDNKDKTVQLIPSGSLAVLSTDIKEIYKQNLEWKSEEKSIEVTYKRQKDNWFVISGYNHDTAIVFYEKRFYYDEKVIGYIFSYPIKSNKNYEKYIKMFNTSFTYLGNQ